MIVVKVKDNIAYCATHRAPLVLVSWNGRLALACRECGE